MKVAVSAASPSLESSIDPRFGRCQYFLVVDPDTLVIDAFPNTSKAAASGAGISAAQTIVNKDVNVVITGRVGPNALDVLSVAGIEIVTGASGTVRETLEQFTSGQLQPMTASQIPAGRVGMSRGRGKGRRRGGGFGRRQNLGRQDATTGNSLTPMPVTTGMSKEQEIQMLEAQAQHMQQQLTYLRKRLDDLKT